MFRTLPAGFVPRQKSPSIQRLMSIPQAVRTQVVKFSDNPTAATVPQAGARPPAFREPVAMVDFRHRRLQVWKFCTSLPAIRRDATARVSKASAARLVRPRKNRRRQMDHQNHVRILVPFVDIRPDILADVRKDIRPDKADIFCIVTAFDSAISALGSELNERLLRLDRFGFKLPVEGDGLNGERVLAER
jgi:hypothetical protein